MNKLLCIVGPTGTGKTKRAIEESLKQSSILVSADSRQVYRGMDIVTGKDHPDGLTVYGTDIVDPDQPCSVSVWYDSVMPHIFRAWDQNKQVIVVGGTGLYVKAITQGIPTMAVPINQPLRDELATLSILELQAKLKKLDTQKFSSMNHSDANNPRRLTRAIEIVKHRTSHPERAPASRMGLLDTNLIGLKYSDLSIQRNKIIERVNTRIKQGAIRETKSLIEKYDKNLQSLSGIGYKSILDFIEGKTNQDELVERWVADELAYAKRQLTWFRKQSVIWYDVDTYGITQN